MNLIQKTAETFFLFLIVSCGTKTKTTAVSGVPKTETHATASKVTVSGNITQTQRHCGGMAPTKELLEELAAPKPVTGKKLYLIKGDTNTTEREIVLSFVSDAEGNFSFQAAPGLYSIILEEQIAAPDAKKYVTETQSINEDCYKKWWGKPYYLLEIKPASKPTSIKGLTFNFHKRCFIASDVPCLEYEGPHPP